MTRYRRNEDRFGPARSNRNSSSTDSLRVIDRYEEGGETWLVVSSVIGPFLEIDVRERDTELLEG
ncbi:MULTISPECIES: hypothetical protein [Halorussus]|uniref:hypothetical protein n=1 Tax=Halorussus TaxID=1070314 RepID=UPI0020A0CED8|nr:hypothetical protein [Halorussus vallis]USZ77524.1 hypothetical protein NGM07_09350 [Halorussus vallis]